MKDEGPNVFKFIKTNPALDSLKNNTSTASAYECIIFDISKSSHFIYYIMLSSFFFL